MLQIYPRNAFVLAKHCLCGSFGQIDLTGNVFLSKSNHLVIAFALAEQPQDAEFDAAVTN